MLQTLKNKYVISGIMLAVLLLTGYFYVNAIDHYQRTRTDLDTATTGTSTPTPTATKLSFGFLHILTPCVPDRVRWRNCYVLGGDKYNMFVAGDEFTLESMSVGDELCLNMDTDVTICADVLSKDQIYADNGWSAVRSEEFKSKGLIVAFGGSGEQRTRVIVRPQRMILRLILEHCPPNVNPVNNCYINENKDVNMTIAGSDYIYQLMVGNEFCFSLDKDEPETCAEVVNIDQSPMWNDEVNPALVKILFSKDYKKQGYIMLYTYTRGGVQQPNLTHIKLRLK